MKIIDYIKHPGYFLLKMDKKNLINLSDTLFLKLEYKKELNKKLNIDNPKTFNEKLQWLKLHNRKDEFTNLVDKYEVRNEIKKIIGEEYLIPLIGVYNSYNEIDFEKLPDKFVIKPTQSSGNVYICKDKSKIKHLELKKTIEKWLKRNYYKEHREWPYKNVKPRIIIEKYMDDSYNCGELIDFKFFCFGGKAEFLYVSTGLSNHKTANIDFVNMFYEKVSFYRKDYKRFTNLPPKPKNFEKMKYLAEKLAKDKPFIRVDFYEIDGKIYFGELTFYPCAGYIPIEPQEWDEKLGDLIDISKIKDSVKDSNNDN